MTEKHDRDLVGDAIAADRKNTRREIWVIIAINFLTGLSWLWGSPNRTRSETWEPAKRLLDFLPWYPMRYWGLVFLTLSLAMACCFAAEHVQGFRWTLRVLALYWAFWAGMTAYSFGFGFISFISLGLTFQG